MSDTYYYENEGLMKRKHIERAEELYEQLDEYIETIINNEEDKSIHEAAEEFFEKKVKNQCQQVKKVFEAMRDYNSNVEGGDLKELSLKNYW